MIRVVAGEVVGLRIPSYRDDAVAHRIAAVVRATARITRRSASLQEVVVVQRCDARAVAAAALENNDCMDLPRSGWRPVLRTVQDAQDAQARCSGAIDHEIGRTSDDQLSRSLQPSWSPAKGKVGQALHRFADGRLHISGGGGASLRKVEQVRPEVAPCRNGPDDLH